MALEFCPKCHQMLFPKAASGQVVLVCRNCSYSKKFEGSPLYKLAKEVRRTPSKEATIIIDEKGRDVRVTLTMNAICPKCGHQKASWWTAQTRRADEGPTIFLRCLKCEHTWREYA